MNHPAPIFITGCGKSGTSIIFQILMQHKDLAHTTGYPDGEDHVGWIKFGKCKMAGLANLKHENYGDGITGQNTCPSMSSEDVDSQVRQQMNAYYVHIANEQKKQRVINKNPHISNKIEYVASIFPSAKFIHIVRDCYSMVESWKKVIKEHGQIVAYLPPPNMANCHHALSFFALRTNHSLIDFPQGGNCTYPGSNGEPFAHYWLNINRYAIKYGLNNPNKIIFVRFEDFISEPIKNLEKIREFLGLASYSFKIINLDKKRALGAYSNANESFKYKFSQDLLVSIEDLRTILGY